MLKSAEEQHRDWLENHNKRLIEWAFAFALAGKAAQVTEYLHRLPDDQLQEVIDTCNRLIAHVQDMAERRHSDS